jgi:hypothetical protein
VQLRPQEDLDKLRALGSVAGDKEGMGKIIAIFGFVFFAAAGVFLIKCGLPINGTRCLGLAGICLFGGFATDHFSMRRYEAERRKAHKTYGQALPAIAFICPTCQRSYSAPASVADKPFVCRSCKSSFLVSPIPKAIPAPDAESGHSSR